QAGADAVAVAAPAQRRDDDGPHRPGQPDRQALAGEEEARRGHRGTVPALPEPAADGQGEGEAGGAGRRREGHQAGAGGRLLGAPELARVHVQPLRTTAEMEPQMNADGRRYRKAARGSETNTMTKSHSITYLCSSAFICGSIFFCGSASAAEPKKTTYDEHVLPILRDKCIGCHNQDKKRGG